MRISKSTPEGNRSWPRLRCWLAAAFLLASTAAAQEVVDEPEGARYSLGRTLWHMGHDPKMIVKFHGYLEDKGLKYDSVMPGHLLVPPDTMRRILIEPELLPKDKLSGWTVYDKLIGSGATDAGPTVAMPLEVDRAGMYRLWIRYQTWVQGTAVTSLRIYPEARENYAPVVNDEIYDYPHDKAGLAWKSILVDLEAGGHVLKLGHVTRWWHAKGLGNQPYRPRRIDCIYLTDEIWKKSPSDAELQDLRGESPPKGIQWSSKPDLPEEDIVTWKTWRARPLSWEERHKARTLFELGRKFHKKEIARLAKKEYDEGKRPDYRTPQRQVVFNDTWNMVANPVRAARQIKALQSDVARKDTGYVWHWVDAGSFDTIGGKWWTEGSAVVGSYGDFPGVCEHDLTVARSGDWHVWVRFQNIGYHATWHATVTVHGGGTIQFNRDKQHYPRDIVGRAAWQKIGAIKIPEDAPANNLHLKFWRGRYTTPATYRRIYSFFATTDPNYVPKGTVRPAITIKQYRKRAEDLGAKVKDGYLLETRGGVFSPIAHGWWPGKLDTLSPTVDLLMARDSVRSLQIKTRSVRQKPVTLSVTCDPLTGKNGTFKDRVAWRVVGFVPYGATRQQWSPYCLLRRPDVTIPPLSVASIWLTVDNNGVPPGEYTSQVKLKGRGAPKRTVTLKVRVSPVEIKPEKPVIVGGFTNPPEGEEYIQDYTAHHMRQGWYNWLISKEEMKKRDIRLLVLRRSGEAAVRQTIEKAKKLGLDYDDYYFAIKDEPTGKTEEQLKPYLDEAKVIRAIDPKVHICFNPGEAANLATFQLLDSYADVWQPYGIHRVYHPSEAAAKRAIFTVKPWMWYTTPCYGDKSPGQAWSTYNEIRSIPAQPGNCIGYAFFAVYYPFRDPWDTAYEHIGDVSVFLLPSRHGPVATMAWEAIREAVEHADLAVMVKERAGDDEEAKKLASSGGLEQIIKWLEEKK